MKIENHILSILQLYEYAMAIGKSLDYKESCDLFLRLVLKRKNLNAAWILEETQGTLNSTYAIPSGFQIKETINSEIETLLSDISYCKMWRCRRSAAGLFLYRPKCNERLDVSMATGCKEHIVLLLFSMLKYLTQN